MIIKNEEPISKKHVSWYTIDKGSKIILKEIMEMTYVVPGSDNHATLSQLEEITIKEYDRIRDRKLIAVVLLLEAAMTAVEENEIFTSGEN